LALFRNRTGRERPSTCSYRVGRRAIHANPVENFDLARVVKVFAAYIQFYEFEVRGTQIQNQSVQLPKSLIASVRDKATRDRITAAFKREQR
jgi:hypothetical protein